MSQKDQDLEIEDELAKGKVLSLLVTPAVLTTHLSPEGPPRSQDQDIQPVEEELCA